jgi:hypothetical protein
MEGKAMVRAAILSIGLLVLVGDASAGPDRRWVHVAIDGEDAERVRINVPLSLIETVLPLIEDDEFHHGKIRLDDAEKSWPSCAPWTRPRTASTSPWTTATSTFAWPSRARCSP